MKESIWIVFTAVLAACSSASISSDPDHATALAEITAHFDQFEYDEGMLIVDSLLKKNASDREALVLAARGNVALFNSGRSGQQYFLEDAVSNLEKALDLDDDDPDSWIQLANLLLKKGEFEDGRDAAVRASELLQNRGASIQRISDAWIAAADNEMQIFVTARRPELQTDEEPSPDTIELGQVVLNRLHLAKRGRPGPAFAKSAQVFQWMRQELKALDEFERGIEIAPENASLHDGFQGLYFGMGKQTECVAAYRRLMQQQPGSALLLWHMGRAQFGAADEHRAKGRPEAAMATYAESARTFERYHSLQPEHAAATGHWLAMCNLSRARLALDAGDTEAARTFSAAAFQSTPRVIEKDENGFPTVLDSFNVHYLGLIGQIGSALIGPSTVGAASATLDYYESIISRHPNQFGFVYNNAALTARDLGNAIAESATKAEGEEKDALMARADTLFERSYELYETAVELEPNDARIVNDCGLMLIYHLHRDYDRARELFDHAIEVGKPQVDALPADAPDADRRFIEEAVGDAYQNIGVLLRLQNRPFEDYKAFLEDAVNYYPYRQRTAALLLRTKGVADERAPGLPNPTPAAQRTNDTFDKAKAEAEKKAQEGDYDGALLVLDQVADKLKGHAPYHHLVGKYSRSYADQVRSRNGNLGQIDGLYADAETQLQRAVQLDTEPVEPRLELAQIYVQTGKFDQASVEASKLLSHIRSIGGTDQAWLNATHAVRAEASSRVYIAAKQNEETRADDLLNARTSFRQLEEVDLLAETQIQLWTTLEQWSGDQGRAFEIYMRGLGRNRESSYLLNRVVETALELNASSKAVDALAGCDSAEGRWYLGRARYNASAEQWRGGDNSAAVDQLDSAVADFAASKAANPEFASSADQWTALCLACRGVIRISQDSLSKATKDLLAAAVLSPGDVLTDLGNGYTIKRGILVVADRYRSRNDLGKTELVYRRATEAVPTDGDFANNHGLFARDHATALEAAGETGKAMELYEASYQSYSHAAELEPDSIRLINDRALLLIYHLNRNLDGARDLLLEAIAKGETRLANDPPQDAAALRDLQESVGDCYQNLGYYLQNHPKDLEAAKKNFEKSLTFYPFKSRASTAHLRQVEQALETKGEGEDK